MELTLGTVSFGLEYGLANDFEQVGETEAAAIISFALAEGVLEFDTASAYGEAESILGRAVGGASGVRVNTKLSEKDCLNASTIIESVQRSAKRVGKPEFEAVLIHNPSTLFQGNQKEIKMGLQEVMNLGLSRRVGLSAYSERDIMAAKEVFPELSAFQLPENICDQRSFNSQDLIDLARDGNIISVRSIFLQGVLLMNLENIPPSLGALQDEIRHFHEYLQAHEMDALEACLGYAKTIPWASQLVVGVNSVEQLQALTKVFNSDGLGDYSDAPRLEANWLDPRTWS